MQTMMSCIPDNISLESVRATWRRDFIFTAAISRAAGRKRCLLVRRKRGSYEKGGAAAEKGVSKVYGMLFQRIQARRHHQPPPELLVK